MSFRELKERIRRLKALLADGGAQDASFAQPVSAVRRTVDQGVRSRDPSAALRAVREKAENPTPSKTRSAS